MTETIKYHLSIKDFTDLKKKKQMRKSGPSEILSYYSFIFTAYFYEIKMEPL